MESDYDVIVVGARCAGAPTAMLLARKGYRVLVVDRATFPSDTPSTHVIHAPGVAALRRWGLLDRVVATGCPPIATYALNFGAFTISGTPRPAEGVNHGYAPRRTVLDKVLVDAAAAAGAEVAEGFSVTRVDASDGAVVGIGGNDSRGRPVSVRARVVVGADGRHSQVARAVRADTYLDQPRLQWTYYSYFSGVPVDGLDNNVRTGRSVILAPTNDDLTMVSVSWAIADAAQYRADVDTSFMRTIDQVPSVAERVRAGRREERYLGAAVENVFRKPYGPGWALVGDAGYLKDPITGHGIMDAFRDAELCATALDEALSGARPYDEAMAAHHQARDEHVQPFYEFTTQSAKLAEIPAEARQLLRATHGQPEFMDAFVSMVAGTVSPAEFYDKQHIMRILAGAAGH